MVEESIPGRSESVHGGLLTGLSGFADASADRPPEALTAARKRALDLISAIGLLVVLSPIWLACSVAIKLTSRGPVIFRQERIGANGKSFTVYKFRTMRVGNSDDVHRAFVTPFILGSVTVSAGSPYKLRRDGRITRVGRFMRKLSIDELPQLLNVLRGEMSIVGPRPPLRYEVEHYENWQIARLAVRPGITGLWQVSGRNRLSFTEMCRLDIEYINSWTVRRDMAIMLRTPWVMLVDRGGAE